MTREPVWMATGQVAGHAAFLAKEGHTCVADVDPRECQTVSK